MKQFYFLFLIFLFSVSLLKAQAVAVAEPEAEAAEETYISGEYHHLDGAFYFDMNEDGDLVLHWEGVHSDAGEDILYFQVLVSDVSLIESGIDTWKGLAILSGNESSYMLPNLGSEHPLLYRLLTSYTNGEIAKSEVIDLRTLSDNRFLGGFDYSYDEHGHFIISWKTAGILPLYYIVHCGSLGWDEWISGDVTSYYMDQGRLYEGMHPVSVLAVYEDGEEYWIDEALVIEYLPDMVPQNFVYEIYEENYLYFWWESGANDGGGPYGIEHNGNLLYNAPWGDYYGWDTYFDYSDFNVNTGNLNNYCDYSFDIDVYINSDYTFFNYTHDIKTYMQHNFKLYMFHNYERGIKATNDLYYSILYGTPTRLEYSTESSEVYLCWENPVEGKIPYEYRIVRNGYDIGGVPGEENTFNNGGLSNGLYNYLIVAVYENDITIPSGIIQVAVNGSPVGYTGIVAPQDISCQVENTNNAVLHWSLSPYGILPSSYRIERDGQEIAVLDGSDLSYMDPDLEIGTYYYRVFINYPDGRVIASDYFYVTVSLAIPGNFTYIINGGNTIALSWTIPSGVQPRHYSITCNGETIAENLPSGTRTYSHTDVGIGTHTYILYAKYSNGNIREARNRITVEISPAMVENFTYTLEDFNNVSLSWEVSENGIPPESYRILREEELIAELPTGVFTYTDQNLEPGTYTYRLLAYYGIEEVVEAENVVSVEIISEEVDLISIPFSYFLYGVQEDNNIAVVWSDTAIERGQVQYYRIERNGQLVAELDSNSFFYMDSNLSIGTYSYRLLVYYINNQFSSSENEVTFTVNNTYPTVAYGFPTHLVHYIENHNDVVLRWDIPLKGSKPLYYKIHRDGNIIGQVGSDTSIYFDVNLAAGTYSYLLSGYYADNTQKMSNDPLIVTIENFTGNIPIRIGEDEHYIRMLIDTLEERPVRPENFTHILSDNSVSLTWNHPEGGLRPVYYQIERNGDLIAQIEGNLNSYFDLNLEDGTYAYRLSAYYDPIITLYAKEWVVLTILLCD